MADIRRREFIALLGGAAAIWPLVTWAQQRDRMQRIGVLMSGDENDPEYKSRVSAFTQALSDLGWTDGRNMRMDVRWCRGDINRIRALTRELVTLQSDIILASSTPIALALQQETRTIPIVFASLIDPLASGIVTRLDRPGANITGFGILQASLGGKWIQVLSEILPGLKRAAMMFNPDTTRISTFLPSIETATRSLNVVPIVAPVHSEVEIETAMIALGREPGGGLVVMGDLFNTVHRASIIVAAARNNVAAVYPASYFAKDGGLLSYGNDQVDTYRGAATYVDRILRGVKPGDLPVQFPTKYEMVLNLKTARALGINVPRSIIARADEVIE